MRELLKVREAAALFGVHPATVRRWIEEGKLSSGRTPGGQIRIPAEVVCAHLERIINGIEKPSAR